VYHMGSQTSGSRLNTFTVCWTTQNMIRVLVHNYPSTILLRHWPIIMLHHFGWLFLRVLVHNYPSTILLRHWPIIMLHHFGWLFLMILRRQFPSYLEGIRSAFRCLPTMLKKRNQWNTRITIPDSLFWDMVVQSEKDILASVMRRRGFKSQYARLIQLYLKIFNERDPGHGAG
jgi:hypothetical protein